MFEAMLGSKMLLYENFTKNEERVYGVVFGGYISD
jgi:hypothetical protein